VKAGCKKINANHNKSSKIPAQQTCMFAVLGQ